MTGATSPTRSLSTDARHRLVNDPAGFARPRTERPAQVIEMTWVCLWPGIRLVARGPDSPARVTDQAMQKLLSAALAAVLLVIPAAGWTQSRIKDIAAIEGVRTNQLVGYGLVVGGDLPEPERLLE